MKTPSVARSQGSISSSKWLGRIASLFLLSLLVLCAAPTTSPGITITIDFGRQSQGCNGFGICNITTTLATAAHPMPADAQWVNGRLKLDFLTALPGGLPGLPVDQDIVLSTEASHALGYEHVTVRAGQYPIDYSTNPNGTLSPDVTVQGLVITVDVGRPSQGCSGFGICSITVGPLASTRAVEASATWIGGELQLSFLGEPADKSTTLVVDQDIVLDPATARGLGYEHVTLKAGSYPVDYSTNPHGVVKPEAFARGIIITIDCRRHCTGGFGFCGITIETSASAAAVQTVATWDQGQLHLGFLSDPPGKTNVLVIDDDIVLNSTTAQALGYQQVTIRAGSYPVDYSTNPHGEVTPNVTALGLTVTIRIGRPSQDCSGFGLCSITIDRFASARAVATSAAWVSNRLQLSFLSDPPNMGPFFTIDEDVTLDSPTSGALGCKQVVLRAGTYPVDYSSNPHGQVNIDTARFGIIIEINHGRGTNCTGFGICSITISWSTTRSVPAIATLTDGQLTLDYLLDPPDKTNLLVLDQDVVLDDATALAMGYQHVTLRAGQYPVDYSVNPHGTVRPDVTAQGLVITIYTGRSSQGCSGVGICRITVDWLASARAVQAAATWSNGRLYLDYLSNPPDQGTLLTIDQDIVVDAATARALGYEKLTVKAGQYPVDYSTNPHGQVSPDIAGIGIVITVEVGRASKGCRGFGVCSITIGFDFNSAARAVPTSATWTNGGLQLSFLTEPPDKTNNVIEIDEDIVLDSATSGKLGYGHVTVLKGSYPVDFSTNPYGVATVGALARGITVTVNIGRRPSCNLAFSICSIVIDTSASPTAVQTSATVANGALQLDFLTEPPAKSNLMVLPEDIVLDGPTSRALGYEHVTVLAGSYPVDFSTNPHGTVTPTISAQGLVVEIKLGKRSAGCTGFGICSIRIDPFADPSARAVPTSTTWINGALQLNFLAEPPDKTTVLDIDEDIELDAATARGLGYGHVTVLKGHYPVDYSTNPHGTVTPDIAARGIIITIGIGRSSQGCAEYGFCLIIRSEVAMNRGVPATVGWTNGGLQFSLLAEPPDKSGVITIDQDIVLDPALARALGYQQLTVLAGTYPVDYSTNPHGDITPHVTAQGLVINIKVGRPNQGCSGFGICSITIDPWGSARNVATAVTWVNGRLKLDFLSEPPDKSAMFVIDQDIALDSATARAMGYEQVTLRAGQYPLDTSVNPHGQVSPDVNAIKIIITITVGKPSKSCFGFGICSVDIDISFSARAVPATAQWVNGRLQLGFLAEPPDKTNLMVIEQDLVLSGPTARALGYEHVTVKAGQYPVDYSTNPNGVFSPDVTTQGLVVTIYVGRRSQNCTGFGICGITIDTSASARAVPASVTWLNGNFRLNFLSDPPDKSGTMFVDQPVILDSRTSRALGYDQIVVNQGQYAVAFTGNPFGFATPGTVTSGLKIVKNPNGSLSVGWPTNGWTLQETLGIGSTWTNSPVQTSPLNLTPGPGQKLYRLTTP